MYIKQQRQILKTYCLHSTDKDGIYTYAHIIYYLLVNRSKCDSELLAAGRGETKVVHGRAYLFLKKTNIVVAFTFAKSEHILL